MGLTDHGPDPPRAAQPPLVGVRATVVQPADPRLCNVVVKGKLVGSRRWARRMNVDGKREKWKLAVSEVGE